MLAIIVGVRLTVMACLVDMMVVYPRGPLKVGARYGVTIWKLKSRWDLVAEEEWIAYQRNWILCRPCSVIDSFIH
jgi:hypothetical protein